MKNLSTENIFSAALKAGFDLKKANDIIIKISDDIEITVSNDEDLSSFSINTRRVGQSIVASARAYNLCSLKNTLQPSYSLNTYDEINFFSDMGITFEDVECSLDDIDYANRMTLALLKEFKNREQELVISANEKSKEIEKLEHERSLIHEKKRLKRIEDFNSKMEKIGEKKAEQFIKEMECETFETEIGVTRTFIFLTRSGHRSDRKLSTKWEKGRLSWYSAKGRLLMHEEVLDMLTKARIEKS